jgi:hypothetical protein
VTDQAPQRRREAKHITDAATPSCKKVWLKRFDISDDSVRFFGAKPFVDDGESEFSDLLADIHRRSLAA